jgi:hypothetical protein
MLAFPPSVAGFVMLDVGSQLTTGRLRHEGTWVPGVAGGVSIGLLAGGVAMGITSVSDSLPKNAQTSMAVLSGGMLFASVGTGIAQLAIDVRALRPPGAASVAHPGTHEVTLTVTPVMTGRTRGLAFAGRF